MEVLMVAMAAAEVEATDKSFFIDVCQPMFNYEPKRPQG